MKFTIIRRESAIHLWGKRYISVSSSSLRNLKWNIPNANIRVMRDLNFIFNIFLILQIFNCKFTFLVRKRKLIICFTIKKAACWAFALLPAPLLVCSYYPSWLTLLLFLLSHTQWPFRPSFCLTHMRLADSSSSMATHFWSPISSLIQ